MSASRASHERELLQRQKRQGDWTSLQLLHRLGTWTTPEAHDGLPALWTVLLDDFERFNDHMDAQAEDVALALLADCQAPFKNEAEAFALGQQALTLGAPNLFTAIVQHPTSPTREAWLAQTWSAQRGKKARTWPSALADLSNLPRASGHLLMAVSQGLSTLFSLGWPQGDREGLTWLAHMQATHLPIAQAFGHEPTLADRTEWARRVASNTMKPDDQSLLTAAFAPLEETATIVLDSSQQMEAMARLLKDFPAHGTKGEMAVVRARELHPHGGMRVPGKGLDGKASSWTLVGAIAMQLLRKKYSEDATRLVNFMDPDWLGEPTAEASPGISERGLVALTDAGSERAAEGLSSVERTRLMLQTTLALAKSPLWVSMVASQVSQKWQRAWEAFFVGRTGLLIQLPPVERVEALQGLFRKGVIDPREAYAQKADKIPSLLVKLAQTAHPDDPQAILRLLLTATAHASTSAARIVLAQEVRRQIETIAFDTAVPANAAVLQDLAEAGARSKVWEPETRALADQVVSRGQALNIVAAAQTLPVRPSSASRRS
jgi:hypothetical protein